jgi:hypothetical protein
MESPTIQHTKDACDILELSSHGSKRLCIWGRLLPTSPPLDLYTDLLKPRSHFFHTYDATVSPMRASSDILLSFLARKVLQRLLHDCFSALFIPSCRLFHRGNCERASPLCYRPKRCSVCLIRLSCHSIHPELCPSAVSCARRVVHFCRSRKWSCRLGLECLDWKLG